MIERKHIALTNISDVSACQITVTMTLEQTHVLHDGEIQ